MTQRKPLLALAGALVMPGLGHLYAGDIVHGFICLIAATLVIPVATCVAQMVPTSALCFVVLLGVATTLGLYAASVVGAVRLAKRRPNGGELPYQRAAVYGLYVICGYLLVLRPAAEFVRNDRLEAFKVPSASMSPSIMPGDRLFVDKTIGRPRGRRLWRGAVAVFIYPNERTSLFVKRVIGLPGDKIQVLGERVIVNGRELETAVEGGPDCESQELVPGRCLRERGDHGTYTVLWSVPKTQSPQRAAPDGTWTVPDGHVFVLGDNRGNAIDSRTFGTVPLSDIVGVARQVWFSSSKRSGVRWNRVGRVLD